MALSVLRKAAEEISRESLMCDIVTQAPAVISPFRFVKQATFFVSLIVVSGEETAWKLSQS
jgi:hypothetical protein